MSRITATPSREASWDGSLRTASRMQRRQPSGLEEITEIALLRCRTFSSNFGTCQQLLMLLVNSAQHPKPPSWSILLTGTEWPGPGLKNLMGLSPLGQIACVQSSRPNLDLGLLMLSGVVMVGRWFNACGVSCCAIHASLPKSLGAERFGGAWLI